MKNHGVLICFTGIDGSGKTTQAKMLVDWLRTRGVVSTYVWSRGEMLAVRGLFLSLGRRALGTSSRQISTDKKSYQSYQAKKGRYKSNPLVRALWSTMTRIEHLAQINRDIRPKIEAGNVVICDRYLWDSIIDLAVLHRKQPDWLTNWLNRLMWRFVPQPAATFFIDIPPEEALKRKNDIPSLDDVSGRADHYRRLANDGNFEVLDGCADVAAIQSQVVNRVRELLTHV